MKDKIVLRAPCDTKRDVDSDSPQCEGRPQSKLPGLELLRFIAAFAVLIWHYQHFAFDGKAIDVIRAQQPFYALIWPFYEFGLYGVQIFWSVSGFIFFWRYRENIANRRVTAWNFFVLRLSRLYPLHFLTLLIVGALQLAYVRNFGHYFVYQNNDLKHFVLQILMASNWGFQNGFSFNGPIWSISVEVLIYFAFFVFLRVLGRSSFVNLAAVGLCFVMREAGMASQISDCLGLFYGGGLAANLLRAQPRTSVRLAIFALAIAVPLTCTQWFRSPSEGALFNLAMAYLPILLFCLAQPMSIGPRFTRWIEAAGNMTYSSYLLHFPIQVALALCYGSQKTSIPVYSRSFFCLYLAAIAIAACLGYRYLELPAQNWMRKKLLLNHGRGVSVAEHKRLLRQ